MCFQVVKHGIDRMPNTKMDKAIDGKEKPLCHARIGRQKVLDGGQDIDLSVGLRLKMRLY